MIWQFAFAVHMVLATVFALLYRNLAVDLGDRSRLVNLYVFVIGIFPLGIVMALLWGDVDFNLPARVWIFLVGGGFLFAISNIAAFKSNQEVDAGQFSIISNSRTIVTIIVSSYFLKETLSNSQLVGVVGVLAAALLVASTHFNIQTLNFNKHSLLAFLSAGALGLAISYEKHMLDQMSTSTYLVVGWGAQTLAVSILAFPEIKHYRMILENKIILKKVLLLAFSRGFGGLFFVYSLNASDNSSLIAALLSSKPAVIVVAAYIFLNERDNLFTKFIGVVVGIVGLLLVAEVIGFNF